MSQMEPHAVKSAWNRHIYRFLTGAALLLIATGTVAYRLLEDWSWVDSLYFSVVAVTTVGFGDLTPTSDASKQFTVVYIFFGVGLIAAFLNARLKARAVHRFAPGDDA